MTIGALLFIAVLVSTGYFVAAHQARSAAGARRAAVALYAAEAGLSTALARWDPARAASLSAGSVLTLETATIEPGAAYSVWLYRLSPGSDDPAYFLISSIGHSRTPIAGRRQVAMLLRAASDFPCCAAALVARGGVHTGGGARVSGHDGAPEEWLATPHGCDNAASAARPGIMAARTDGVRLERGARVEGDPAVSVSPAQVEELLARAEPWNRDLVALADVELAHGTTLRGVGPTLSRDGGCDRSVLLNWGAPRQPHHACHGYLPIVHAADDLIVEGPGSGQGILVADGDLELRGGFSYYGVVVVRGRFVSRGDSRVRGGVMVLSADSVAVELAPGSDLGYSACAVARAVQAAKLLTPRPLAQFSWLEILN